MNIKWLVLDVDGVFTNGHIIYTSAGEELKAFYAQDGLAIAAARKVGLRIAIITGRISPILERRAEELKIDTLIMGCRNKSEALQALCEEQDVNSKDIAYMGDDLNDLGVLHMVGLPLAPANGCEEVKSVAKYVTTREGGYGAIREAIEYILKNENLWSKVVDSYKNETYTVGQ